MAEQEQKKAETRKYKGLYRVLRVLTFLAFHTFWPIAYHGKEKLPASGPYILVSNHLSNWDPLVNAYPIKKDQVIYLGKKELAGNPVFKWIFKHLNMIPVDRHHTDMAAMRSCMKTLKDGDILGIYPEGTRHHQGVMEETEDGVALIALRGNAPVVPMLIASKVRPFHVTHVYIGDEIQTEDLKKGGVNKEACQAFMDRLRTVYADLVHLHETHGQVD